MTLAFVGVMVLDGWLDGSLTASEQDDLAVRGTLLAVVVVLLVVAGVVEFAQLARARGLEIFLPVAATAAAALASSWYWGSFWVVHWAQAVLGVIAAAVVAMFLYQYRRFGSDGALANCGVNCLAILYLGGFSSFVVGIRLQFGLWALLTYVFVVKSSDIGAYTAGRLWGTHKCAPRLSPGKSWEGLAGAVVTAVVVAVSLGRVFGIMNIYAAGLFGVCFALAGQLGDLAESMLKRDAQQKDSGRAVPGFGGVLDVVDSALMTAPLAYLFFWCCGR